MAKARSGGGISGNKVVDRKAGWKAEPKAYKQNPSAVFGLGTSTAYPKPQVEDKAKGYEPQKMGSTGIANARKGPEGAGPGGMSRTIYRSGSQSPTPPAKPLPPGRSFDE